MRAFSSLVLVALMLSCAAVSGLAQDAGLPPLGKDAIENVGQVVSKYDRFTDKSKIELALPVKGNDLDGLYLFAVCVYSGQAVPDNAKVVLGIVSIGEKYKFENNDKIILLVDGERQVYDPERFPRETDFGPVIELLLIKREFSVDELLRLAAASELAGRAGNYDEFEVSASNRQKLLEFARRMRPLTSPGSSTPRVHVVELPSNFHYVRTPGRQAEPSSYVLTPDEGAMDAAGGAGEEFQALGVTAQPEANKAAIIFYNAAKQFQLQTAREKGFRLTIERQSFNIPAYQVEEQKDLGKLKLETARIQITKEILWKLVNADHVTAQCGTVIYELDRDNIEALKYLATQIEKDSKPVRR